MEVDMNYQSETVNTYEVSVFLDKTSQPIRYDAISTYQKGDMFCVAYYKDGKKLVDKWPMNHIWKVSESYQYL